MRNSNDITASGVVALVLVAIVAIAVIILMVLAMTGLSVGAANSWILQGNFVDGWSAVWDRWFVALGWALLFGGGAGSGYTARSKKG